jgi:hypothetical protein
VVGALLAVPLVDEDGLVVGALTAHDRRARRWSPPEVTLLQELATSAMGRACPVRTERRLRREQDAVGARDRGGQDRHLRLGPHAGPGRVGRRAAGTVRLRPWRVRTAHRRGDVAGPSRGPRPPRSCYRGSDLQLWRLPRGVPRGASRRSHPLDGRTGPRAR